MVVQSGTEDIKKRRQAEKRNEKFVWVGIEEIGDFSASVKRKRNKNRKDLT
jgi:hypothetical protein